MIESITNLYEKLKKAMSDLVSCYTTFSVFAWNPILWAKCKENFPWRKRKIWRISYQITCLFFQLPLKLNRYSNRFQLFFIKRTIIFFNYYPGLTIFTPPLLSLILQPLISPLHCDNGCCHVFKRWFNQSFEFLDSSTL